MPLPIKYPLNDTLLPNTSNEWNVLPWPYGFINNFVSHDEFPLNLLVNDIPNHGPFIFSEPSTDPIRQFALPNCQPLSHRSHERNQLVLQRNLPKVFRNYPMVLLNKEAFPWGNANWHPRSPQLPWIIRHQCFNKLPGHKAKNKCIPGIRAIRLLAVGVHEYTQRIRHSLNINLLIKCLITLIISNNPPPPNTTLNLEASCRSIRVPLGFAIILNMPNKLLYNLCTLLRRSIPHPQYLTALLSLPHIINNLQVVLPCHIQRQCRLILQIPCSSNRVRPLIPIITIRLCELQILHKLPSKCSFPF